VSQHKLEQIAEDLDAYIRLPDETRIEDIPSRLMFARMVSIFAQHKVQRDVIATAICDLEAGDAASAKSLLASYLNRPRVFA
jgi:hypothetical protein